MAADRRARAPLCSVAVLCGLLGWKAAGAAELPELSVELHSHLFMKQSMGPFFRGDFNGPLAATSWRDRFSSKVNAAQLERSGIGLQVVALMAHPVAHEVDLRTSVRRQIALAERFVREHPRWVIARSSQEARRQLLAGKRVLVLSLEGAAGVLESEEDLRELIDEQGIRIVSLLHLTDDRYGGTATLNTFQYLGNPLNVVDQLLDPFTNPQGITVNRRGLTPLGKRLAIELIKRGVWIDLNHASDAAVNELLPLLAAAGQPLLYSHTFLRRYRPAERALPASMLGRIRRSHGVVGLLPTADAFEQIAVPAGFCPPGCAAEQCERSIGALATMYAAVAAELGAEAVVIGNDFNGAMRHLPAACRSGTSLDAEPGYFHLGQVGELWQALRRRGAPVPPLRRMLAYFLDAWARVEPVSPAAGSPLGEAAVPALPSRAEAAGPSLTVAIGAGVSAPTAGPPPGVLLQLEAAVRKDTGTALVAEPIFYLGRAAAEATVAPEGLRQLEIRLSPIAVRAAEWDNVADVELVTVMLRRQAELDQDLAVRAAAIAGTARLMPGVLKAPGRFNLFVQLGADALGYKSVDHLDEAQPLARGFHIIGGSLQLGATVFLAESSPLCLYGGIGADLNLMGSPALGYQSDLDLHGGLRAGLASPLTLFFEVALLGSRERYGEDRLLTAAQLRAGLRAGF